MNLKPTIQSHIQADHNWAVCPRCRDTTLSAYSHRCVNCLLVTHPPGWIDPFVPTPQPLERLAAAFGFKINDPFIANMSYEEIFLVACVWLIVSLAIIGFIRIFFSPWPVTELGQPYV